MMDGMSEDTTLPRKLTHEQAKQEQRLYWRDKSMAERLAAMSALNERLNRMQGIERGDQRTDFAVKGVSRRKR